jgi:hypothetical protein
VCVDGVKGDPRVVSIIRDTERHMAARFAEDKLDSHTTGVLLTSAFLALVCCAGKAIKGQSTGAVTSKQRSHRHPQGTQVPKVSNDCVPERSVV